MRYPLFAALYISIGMAVYQDSAWPALAIGTVAILMCLMGCTFGVFGGKWQ